MGQKWILTSTKSDFKMLNNNDKEKKDEERDE